MTCLTSLANETVEEEKERREERRGTFYVTYPGCTGTQSSVHISWLLPQDSQIISLPWHGTCSTAKGCLTVRDIVCVYVCVCVLHRGPNLHPSAPPADCKPSGPPAIQVDCLSLLTGCMILQINTNYISTRLPWTPSTESASGPYLIIPQRCRLYVSTEQQQLVVLCSARQLNPSERQFTFPTLFAVYSNSFKSNQSIK